MDSNNYPIYIYDFDSADIGDEHWICQRIESETSRTVLDVKVLSGKPTSAKTDYISFQLFTHDEWNKSQEETQRECAQGNFRACIGLINRLIDDGGIY